ncbi:MAG: hypothetical protein VB119_07040 [Candidatus Metalachnospira sp.]|nr:hypothetical protein [Candidatus Metalachnospira sp.]
MLNDIKMGIADKLSGISQATIYTEKVPQGFNEPCFFIVVSSVNQLKDTGGRYKLDYNMIVQYFPQSKDLSNEENADMAEHLYSCLEFITVGENVVMGQDLHNEMVEGVLYFYIRYPIRIVRNSIAAELMGEVKVNAKSGQ